VDHDRSFGFLDQRIGKKTGIAVGVIHLCGPRSYEFEGVSFEVSNYGGPWPLKKNGDPKKRAGRRFYAFYARFEALAPDEQEKHRTGGGCIVVRSNA